MGREIGAHQYVDKKKKLNQVNEAFSMCTHISQDILFHLEGLRTPKECWENIEYLFGKQDELWGYILESELIALQPISFKSVQ